MTPLFPKTCIGCGQISTVSLCYHCSQEWNTKHLQIRKHLSQKGDEIVACCQYNSLGGKIVRSFKYGKRFDLLPVISQGLSRAIAETEDNHISFILPVPQSLRKIFSRGFHPVEMISQEVSEQTFIPMNVKILKRKWDWHEKDQAGLNKIRRLYNLTHSFYATRKELWGENRCILLIDDVATTGTTLSRCKEAIHTQYPDWQIKMLVFAHG